MEQDIISYGKHVSVGHLLSHGRFLMAYESSERSTSTYWARIALLEAVNEVKPQVLAELGDLLPAFRAVKPNLERHHSSSPDQWEWLIAQSKRANDSTLQLRQALETWAKNHNLNFDWVIRSAIYSLIHWDKDEKLANFGWGHDGIRLLRLPAEQTRLVFEMEEVWLPHEESQDAFTKRARKEFAQYLQKYVEEIKSLLDARNHVKMPRKKEHLPGYDDFQLLALKLVWPKTYDEISEMIAQETLCTST